jgi:hypothetical protein
MKRVRRVLFPWLSAVVAVFGVAVVSGDVVAGAADAATTARPHIDVYLADGVTPVGAALIHPGDTLVVRGRGFDPAGNRSGLPLPVPPGVPHGTFIAFGAFAPDWRPSGGAPESARAATRLGVQWALSPEALAQVPAAPFDMRRTIRQQWVPLHADGTFLARVVASTPTQIPTGARYGVYTYGAAGAVNAAQELSIPVNYSTRPGPNTPAPAPRDLVWAYSPAFHRTVTEDAQGGVYGTDGAGIDDSGAMTFTLAESTFRNGAGTLRYRGTVVAFSRFHLVEIALSDPIIRLTDGRGVLSMRTSTSNTNGTDAQRRVDIADVHLRAADGERSVDGVHDIVVAPVRFRPGITPESLALLSTGTASPLRLHIPSA